MYLISLTVSAFLLSLHLYIPESTILTKNIDICLNAAQKTYVGVLLEVPQRGTSYEYTQHVFVQK